MSKFQDKNRNNCKTIQVIFTNFSQNNLHMRVNIHIKFQLFRCNSFGDTKRNAKKIFDRRLPETLKLSKFPDKNRNTVFVSQPIFVIQKAIER